MPIVTIPASRLQPYEVAAALLSIVIAPNELPARKRAHDALLSEYFQINAWNPNGERMTRGGGHLLIDPYFIAIDRAKAERDFSGTWKKLSDRLLSGRTAGAYMFERNGRSIDDLLGEIAAARSASGEVKNLVHRLWSPSKPVLHLCYALERRIFAGDPSEDEWIGKLYDILDGDGIDWVLSEAHRIRPVILAHFSERSRLSDDKLIGIELA